MPPIDPATSAPALPKNGVAIWLTFLADIGDSERAAYRKLLDPHETERHDRYKVAGARDEFLVGRALVRTTLSRYRDVAPADWRFETNRHGRPAIIGEAADGLMFNLSHTRGLVALAVSRGCEIGVDVEAVGRESATFEYDDAWLKHRERFALEPALQLGPGPFHTGPDRALFGAIGDSAPDRWGRVLMRRAERRRARQAGEAARTLWEIDYLLLVDDEARQGEDREVWFPGRVRSVRNREHAIPR